MQLKIYNLKHIEVFLLLFIFIILGSSGCNIFGNTSHLETGARFLDLENYDIAISRYAQAIEEDPTLAEAYLGRGKAYYGLWRFRDAGRKFARNNIRADREISASPFQRMSRHPKPFSHLGALTFQR